MYLSGSEAGRRLQAVSPLKINLLQVVDAEVTC
jgi:hypothetical protein